MIKFILTGPECSGKTTLCTQISNYFNIPFSKEYAREYLNNLDYCKEDLLKIAKEQFKSEDSVLTILDQKISLHDTDLITIKIWSEYKFGFCDNWILDLIEKQKRENRFYLLCSPDIPWKEDFLRENPFNRSNLFDLYKQEIESLGHNYFIIEGDKRFEKSIQRIITKLY